MTFVPGDPFKAKVVTRQDVSRQRDCVFRGIDTRPVHTCVHLYKGSDL